MPTEFLGVMLGVFFHWLGGLAAGSFYLPYRFVRKWSWETMWLTGGVFSWIIAPLVLAFALVPDVPQILREAWAANAQFMIITYLCGVGWGFGGLTFGLSMRYLGIGLGMAVALSYCTAFGTLVPLFIEGTFLETISKLPGWIVLAGVATCLSGIVITGAAGMKKEKELPDEVKKESVKEFDFMKGMLVATFSGIMSAFFAYGQNSFGKPIGEAALAHIQAANGGVATAWDMFQNLPILIVILLGGFTTNFFWCVFLNIKNKSGREYFTPMKTELVEVETGNTIDEGEVGDHGVQTLARPTTSHAVREQLVRVPMLANYVFAAAAGTIWYFQFFFYSMGQTKMGRFDFSSWTLHMSSIIIFSSIWGIVLKEWRGSSAKTKSLVFFGIVVLVLATVIVGYGNYMATWPEYAGGAPAAGGH